jgi:DNA-binding CsgD family transcriptional regulator
VESDSPSSANPDLEMGTTVAASQPSPKDLALKVAELEMRLLEVLALVRELPGASQSASKTSMALQDLSDREREVARYLSLGLNSATVAKELGISVHTVRSHTRRVYEKLGVHSQGELTARLQRNIR